MYTLSVYLEHLNKHLSSINKEKLKDKQWSGTDTIIFHILPAKPKGSFSYLKFTKYVTNIIAEPKYKYGGQQEQENSKEPQQNPYTRINDV